ncbi:MAG: hypothetical protein IT222_12175 [Crocinitomix sp.]|nr:hypothetical protein [Crocinitomix sp.]
MKIIFTFFIVVLVLVSCKTNNYLKYHRIVNEAEYSFFNEDYQTASELFEKAFKKVPIPFENDMHYLSASLWEIGEFERSVALLDTLHGVEYALTKSGFYQGMDSITRNEIIQNNKEKIAVIDRRRANNPIVDVLVAVNKRDLVARSHWQEIVNDNPNDSLLSKQAWSEVDRVDSINLLVIDSLFEIHGFIGGVFYPANLIIMHISLLHQLEWVYNNPKLFKKAIKQGRLVPCYYAIAYDKAMLYYKNDTIVQYGQFSTKLNGVSPEEVFKAASKIGVSPYFEEWVHFPREKGRQPKKHFYYEYYAAKKDRFNCY